MCEEQREIPATNEIELFFHCRECIEELPSGESPASYARHSVGFSKLGIQVWCNRHEKNIVHIDFEGHQHPANMGG